MLFSNKVELCTCVCKCSHSVYLITHIRVSFGCGTGPICSLSFGLLVPLPVHWTHLLINNVQYIKREWRGSPLSAFSCLLYRPVHARLDEFHIVGPVVLAFFPYTLHLSFPISLCLLLPLYLVACCFRNAVPLLSCSPPVMRGRLFSFMSAPLTSSLCLEKQMEPLAKCALVRIQYERGRLEATLSHSRAF